MVNVMRRVAAGSAVLLCLTIAGSAAAQERPDFSGRWTAEAEPPPARGGGAGGRGSRPADMGSGWGSPITITQDANKLTVEYMFFGRGDMQPPLRFVFALDGSETKNTVMMGRGIQEQTARTSWENNKLVIVTQHKFTDPVSNKPMTAEVRQVLSLESPTLLVVETTRAGVLGGPSSTSSTNYGKG
jgi:hypothetical protein